MHFDADFLYSAVSVRASGFLLSDARKVQLSVGGPLLLSNAQRSVPRCLSIALLLPIFSTQPLITSARANANCE